MSFFAFLYTRICAFMHLFLLFTQQLFTNAYSEAANVFAVSISAFVNCLSHSPRIQRQLRRKKCGGFEYSCRIALGKL